MKSKARNLAGEKDRKTDSSDWTPAAPLNADVKTGMRPVGKEREYKAGGSVAKARSDRKPRKSGGRVEKDIGVGVANKDMKVANEQREGKKHIGGMKDGGSLPQAKVAKPERSPAKHYKSGGRSGKDFGGVAEKLSPAYAAIRALQRGGKDEERDVAQAAKTAAMVNAGRKHGGKAPHGRPGRKSGGAAPNLTVIVADKGHARPDQQGAQRPMAVPMPTPTTPPPMQSQMPVVPPPPMPAPGAPQKAPIALKTGGRVAKVASSYKDMEAGAATGEGRLQKTDVAEKRKGAPTRNMGGRAVA